MMEWRDYAGCSDSDDCAGGGRGFGAWAECRPPAKVVAPGVWFLLGDSHKGYSNTVVIEMKDYLIVVDANYPGRAKELLVEIPKLSPKPVKYVFDTHAHGDHSYGNSVWTKAGATTLAYGRCWRDGAAMSRCGGRRRRPSVTMFASCMRTRAAAEADVQQESVCVEGWDARGAVFVSGLGAYSGGWVCVAAEGAGACARAMRR